MAKIRNIGLLSVHSTIDGLGDIGFELISDEVPVGQCLKLVIYLISGMDDLGVRARIISFFKRPRNTESDWRRSFAGVGPRPSETLAVFGKNDALMRDLRVWA